MGIQVARWLAERQAVRHIHIISRSGQLPAGLSSVVAGGGPEPAAGSAQAAAGPAAGVAPATMITVSRADVAAAADMAMAALAPGGGQQGGQPLQLAGVFHAAGSLADALVGSQGVGGVRAVLAAKSLHGIQALVQAQPLATAVLFSSVAALLGSPGQANYAAANAALDAAAAAMQGQGVAAVSVQWGAWAGAGMAAQDAQTAARLRRMGLAMIQPHQALAALSAAVAAAGGARPSPPVTAAVPIHWPSFLARVPQPPSSFFSAFLDALPAATAAAAPPAPARAGGPDARQRRAQEQRVRAAVEEAVTGILGAGVGPEQPLMAAGLDSLGSVELGTSLGATLGLQLPSTLVFDHPTVSALVSHLTTALAAQQAAVGPTVAPGRAVGAAAAPAAGRAAAGVQAVQAVAGRSPGAGAERAALAGTGEGA